ncbi:MAG: tRNA lysidine(34) synthetase TilS [Proteobacteria bacterium]|nr:tRNA lysidine(34) synthetase TilS [Pseudomonadota bacterium]
MFVLPAVAGKIKTINLCENVSMANPPFKPGLLSHVLHGIDNTRWLCSGDALLIAVSGGADSVALLHLFNQLRKPYHFSLAVCHLNHGLRGLESDRDCAFVENLAKAMDLVCHSGFRDVEAHRKKKRLSLEEAARQVRYDFLFETADAHGYSKILTAHHADDNAELLVMNLMRGSGPSGLGGMDTLAMDGRLIRPFLDCTRSDILDYLTQEGLTFREDSSNADRTFLRNRIRLELLPLIECHYQKGFSRVLSRTARIIRDDDAWMNSLIDTLFKGLVIQKNDKNLTLALPELGELHVSAQRRIIRKSIALIKGDLRRIGLIHVESAVRLIRSEKSRCSLDLPDRIRVQREGDTLVFCREARSLRHCPPFEVPPTVSDFDYSVEKPSDQPLLVHIPEANLSFTFSESHSPAPRDLGHTGPDTAFLDMDKLSFPLSLRNHRPGDRFMPLGMPGHRKVSRFFNSMKVPPENRKHCPVLISGEHIVWVCGHRIDGAYRLGPDTKKVLKIELLLA